MSRAPQLDVLYEDNHLLVVDKPAGLSTMGGEPGQESLVEFARRFLKHKYQKPGNVYVGVVSRLDKLTSGVIVLARTSKAAARLTTAFRERKVTKRYAAVVAGSPNPPAGTLEHHLRKSEPQRRMVVSDRDAADAKFARLHYETVENHGEASLLQIRLDTGRKHQIRLQLADYGHPILGDRKYGSTRPFSPGIALHSMSVELIHPVRKTPIKLTAPVPAYWPAWCRDVGL